MKVSKILWMALFLLCVSTNVKAEQRVVVAEGFTATWCGYCPYAARAIHRLSHEVKDSMAVMEYHQNDPFSTSETSARASYYNVQNIPTMWFDGTLNYVGGDGGNYNQYRNAFNTRKNIPSPLSIEIEGPLIDVEKMQAGAVTCVTNTSENEVSGKLYFVITESDIQYQWQTEDSLFDVVRDILPNANGEEISIPAGGFITNYWDFTISPGWNVDNCYIIVFVQASSKEMYQGAKVRVMDLSRVEETLQNLKVKVQNSKLEIYPNPFSRTTEIRIQKTEHRNESDICHLASVICIYDLTGRLVKSFPSFNLCYPSINSVNWDRKDDKGIEVPAGLYFCKLTVGKTNLTRKLVVIK